MSAPLVTNERLRSYLRECAEACNACAEACEYCYRECLRNEEVRREAVRLVRDCADVCNLVRQLITRESPYARVMCSVAANICDASARVCEQYEDDYCRRCAEACRRCADACRELCIS
ncbi:four-helix bundle copper-binding protein [Peribacillus sp. SCS-26]|uniref:four-helix bundle copper-binding protein n=1 Tax=Paraperibacillus marinus TaxID=3115295 RepID=UPI0039059FA2